MDPDTAPGDIHVFLAAHTNVGKTALLRTLLGKDVGVVDDAPEVTTATSSHELVSDADGSALLLWDSPGFGDSFRLAKRLRLRYRWIAWLVREVWDRHRHPSLWRGQRLAHDLQRRADLVLYPVNMLDRPLDAVYVEPELQVLDWVGKPVLVVLNQGGALQHSGTAAERAAEWRSALSAHPVVRSVIDLDAFTRCWIQELTLFDEIGRLLPDGLRSRHHRLARLLRKHHVDRFEASADAIADAFRQIAADRVEEDTGWFSGIADAVGTARDRMPWGKSGGGASTEPGMEALGRRFSQRTQDLADQLLAINRLDGVHSADVLQAIVRQLHVDAPLDATSSSLLGGVASGVATGLAADLMAGGLTLGAGALVGGLLGALGGAAIAKGYNVATSKGRKVIRWSPASLVDALGKLVLLYLSVAHFGRGQGSWRSQDEPMHWAPEVRAVLDAHQQRLARLLDPASPPGDSPRQRAEFRALTGSVLRDVMSRLYPEAGGVFGPEGGRRDDDGGTGARLDASQD